jgi:hypothetical protein
MISMSNQIPPEPVVVRVETIYEAHARYKAMRNAAKEAKRLARKNASFPVKVVRFLLWTAVIIGILAFIGSQK